MIEPLPGKDRILGSILSRKGRKGECRRPEVREGKGPFLHR